MHDSETQIDWGQDTRPRTPLPIRPTLGWWLLPKHCLLCQRLWLSCRGGPTQNLAQMLKQMMLSTHQVDMKRLLSHGMRAYAKSNVGSLAGSEMTWKQEKEAIRVFMVTWRWGCSEDSHWIALMWCEPRAGPHPSLFPGMLCLCSWYALFLQGPSASRSFQLEAVFS